MLPVGAAVAVVRHVDLVAERLYFDGAVATFDYAAAVDYALLRSLRWSCGLGAMGDYPPVWRPALASHMPSASRASFAAAWLIWAEPHRTARHRCRGIAAGNRASGIRRTAAILSGLPDSDLKFITHDRQTLAVHPDGITALLCAARYGERAAVLAALFLASGSRGSFLQGDSFADAGVSPVRPGSGAVRELKAQYQSAAAQRLGCRKPGGASAKVSQVRQASPRSPSTSAAPPLQGRHWVFGGIVPLRRAVAAPGPTARLSVATAAVDVTIGDKAGSRRQPHARSPSRQATAGRSSFNRTRTRAAPGSTSRSSIRYARPSGRRRAPPRAS